MNQEVIVGQKMKDEARVHYLKRGKGGNSK